MQVRVGESGSLGKHTPTLFPGRPLDGPSPSRLAAGGGGAPGPPSPSLTSFFRAEVFSTSSRAAAPYWGNDGSVGNEDDRLHHLIKWIPLVNFPSPASRHQFGNEKGELGAEGRQARCFLSHPRSSGCLIFWGFPERFCACEEGNMQAWVGTYMCLRVHMHVTSVHSCVCVFGWAL